MPFTTLSLGLTLSIPTSGTRNYAATLLANTWTKISAHDHSGGGNGKPITTTALGPNSVTSDKLAKNIALFQRVATLAPVGITQTVDFDEGNIQKLDLDGAAGNVTLTLSNPQAGATYKLFVIQAVAPLDLVWPANVKWPGGQAPILSQTDNAIDIVDLYYDGTDYYGSWEVDFQ